jgi:hypothetical protein
MNEKDERFEENKKNNKSTFITGTLILVTILIMVILIYQLVNVPRGNIIGVLDGWTTFDYGLCEGQYPYTKVNLMYFTMNGVNPWCCFEGENYSQFQFECYYPNLVHFSNGSIISISYHQESRGADSDASKVIRYFVIDDVTKVN